MGAERLATHRLQISESLARWKGSDIVRLSSTGQDLIASITSAFAGGCGITVRIDNEANMADPKGLGVEEETYTEFYFPASSEKRGLSPAIDLQGNLLASLDGKIYFTCPRGMIASMEPKMAKKVSYFQD